MTTSTVRMMRLSASRPPKQARQPARMPMATEIRQLIKPTLSEMRPP